MSLYYLNGYSFFIDVLSILIAGFWIWAGVNIYQLKRKVEDQKDEINALKRKFINLKRNTQPLSEEEEMDYEFMNKPFS